MYFQQFLTEFSYFQISQNFRPNFQISQNFQKIAITEEPKDCCVPHSVVKVSHEFTEIHKLAVKIKLQKLQGLVRAAQI